MAESSFFGRTQAASEARDDRATNPGKRARVPSARAAQLGEFKMTYYLIFIYYPILDEEAMERRQRQAKKNERAEHRQRQREMQQQVNEETVSDFIENDFDMGEEELVRVFFFFFLR